MAREVSLGKRPPWSRLSLPLSPPTTHGVHLAPSRLRAPTGAATCSSPAHGACALRRRDRMAPMVVAANSRGGYPRRPAEQRVNNEFMLGPRAAVARIAHQVQNGCRRSNAHWSRPAATVANADGADGRVKWDRSKRLRRRAACPLVRSPVAASDGRGSSPWERRCGAVGGERSRRSSRVGLSPGARNTTQTAEQSSAQAHSSCEQVAGQRARSSAQAGVRARAGAHTTDTGRRSVSTEITLTYCPVCALVFRAPGDSPTRRAS